MCYPTREPQRRIQPLARIRILALTELLRLTAPGSGRSATVLECRVYRGDVDAPTPHATPTTLYPARTERETHPFLV